MKESDLYHAVRDWLTRQGYEVHVELFGADVVAVKDGKIVVVELKRSFSQDVCQQCINRARWADFVFAAVPHNTERSRRGNIWWADHHGIGILLVNGAKCRQLRKARPQPWGWHKRRAYRVKILTGRAPAMDHETAGLPSCAALREQREKRRMPATV